MLRVTALLTMAALAASATGSEQLASVIREPPTASVRGRAHNAARTDDSGPGGHSCIHDSLLHEEAETHERFRNEHQRRLDQDAQDDGLPRRVASTRPIGLGGAPAGAPAAEREGHGGRRLFSSDFSWAPVRIQTAFVSSPAWETSAGRAVREFLVPRAVTRLREVIEVKPLGAPLRMQRRCPAFWTNSGGKCAQMPETPRCGFASQGILIEPNEAIVGAAEYYPNGPNLPPQTVEAGGSGVARTDFLLFVAMEDAPGCSDTTLAFAAPCQTRAADDRPFVGTVNFCARGTARQAALLDRFEASPTSVNAEALEVSLADGVAVAVHEVFHAMGFTSDVFPLFRDDAGNARTPRSDTNPSEVADSSKRSFSCSQGTRTVSVPDPSVVAFPGERGAAACSGGTLSSPLDCVARAVGPRAAAGARAHFGCTDLAGVELENQPTSECVIIGSHTEQRASMGTVMTAVIGHTRHIDAATLSLLHDSSWWRPNYHASDPATPGRDYGAHAGCSFARDSPCLAAGDPPTQGPTAVTRSQGGASVAALRPRFCTGSVASMCTVDGRAIGTCSVGRFSSPLPTRMQYFTADPNVGGGGQTADFCPMPSGFSNRLCADASRNYVNGDTSQGLSDLRTAYGHSFGKGAVCASVNRLVRNGFIGSSFPAAACMNVRCDASAAPGSPVVRMAVRDDASGEDSISSTCTAEGQAVSFQGYSGTASCPNPALVCGTSGPVAPGEAGTLGAAASRFDLEWPSAGGSPAGLVVTVSRSLFDAASQTASSLPSAAATLTLQPLGSADLDLVGGYASRAQAGLVGEELGFGSGNVTMSTPTATVSWSAGQAGAVSVRMSTAAWSTKPAAPRAFVLRVQSQTAGVAVSATAGRAIVVLATDTGAIIEPTLSGASSAAVGLAAAVVACTLAVSGMRRKL